MRKQVVWIFVVSLFLSFVFLKIALYQPGGVPLKTWSYFDGIEATDISLPYYRSLNQSGVHSFSYEMAEIEAPYLVIPQLYGYAYKLYINDDYLTGIGDFANPTANLWTYAQAVDISAYQQSDNARIRLDIYGLHDVGMSAIPYLTDANHALLRVTVLNVLNHDLTHIIIGFALAFAMLFFFLAFKMFKRKSVYVNYGIALSLFAFYSLEFTFRVTSGTMENYLLMRKLLLMSIYIAGYFLLIAQRSYFLNRKTNPLLSLIYMAPLFFMVRAEDFVRVASIQNIINGITIVTVLYIAFIGLIKRYRATLIPNTILVFTVVHTILNIYFELMHPFILHIGVMVFLFGLSTIVVLDFQVLENENEKLGQLSKLDPLTQAFNRSILTSLNCSTKDCFVFIDLDRFKAYNDTFGHQQGDQLLKDIVSILKHHIRKTDYVIRYGGDEFILYFHSSPESAVSATLKRLQLEIQALGNIDISYGISAYQESVMSTILKADRQMYAMKNEKKKAEKYELNS